MGYNIENSSFHKKLRLLDLHIHCSQDANLLLKSDYDAFIVYGYRKIIPKSILIQMKAPIVNMHISLLPWNKGAHPNFLSHYEGTPSGVSLHLLDSGVDTGPLISQRYVPIDARNHTFESSYKILRNEIEELMLEYIPSIISRKFQTYTQNLVDPFITSVIYLLSLVGGIKTFTKKLFDSNQWS